MTRHSRYAVYAFLALAGLAALVYAWPAAAQTFDINRGIVGNLSEACRTRGDCGFCDFIDLFSVLQKVILSLFGGLAIIMLIWGGQSLITAAGNAAKVAEARKLITSTLMGVGIILAGYFLVSVVIGILTSPVGGTFQSKIFGTQDWQRAYCGSPSDASFCQQRSEGTACVIDGASGFCQNKTCVTACEYQYGGSGYGCYDVSYCKNHNLIGQDLAGCTPANECYRGLCPGPTTTICCTTTN